MISLASSSDTASTVPPPVVPEPSDRALVIAHFAGDRHALAQLVTRHRGYVLATCHRALSSHWDAEEIASQTFVKALRYLPTFEWRCSLRTWLHHIAVGLCHNRFAFERRRGAGKRVSMSATIYTEDGQPIDLHTAMGEIAVSRDEVLMGEMHAVVAEGMAALAPRYRQILRLHCVKHLTYPVIASRLSICEGTVKSRLSRARDDLVRAISRRHPELTSRFARGRKAAAVHATPVRPTAPATHALIAA